MELYTRVQGDGPPLVLLHGLFGSNENLGGIARALADRFTIYAMDLRNHGRSPHGEPMDYPTLAGDIATTMATHGLERAAMLGHSVGGKTAMQLALTAPDRIERLVVVDIAPIAYRHGHDRELDAMRSLDLTTLASRADADAALAGQIPEAPIRQFLLKNLVRGNRGFTWRIPLDTIAGHYGEIAAAPSAPGPYRGPSLFLRGEASDYVPPSAETAIHAFFPTATIETIAGAGHWLHVQAAEATQQALARFLEH